MTGRSEEGSGRGFKVGREREREREREMEAADDNKSKEETPSYRYWVRETTADAAPLPQPKKISSSSTIISDSPAPLLGSAWNSAGTWEEKNLNKWASDRIKELVMSVGSLEFSAGTAQITEVSRCSGDAFLVTVRNKKRVGYTYELSLKIKGEWMLTEENKTVKGHVDIPEFSFGELDDLQMEVKVNDEKDLSQQQKLRILENMKQFLEPVREKLLQFEQELKDR